MRPAFNLVMLVIAGTLAGCSSGSVESQVAAMNGTNLKRVTNLYAAYQMRNGNLGPKDMAALKDFVQHTLEPRRLEMMQIKPDEFDKLTVSERDGKPFKIRFGVQSGPLTPPAPIVFEDTGVGGIREVGFTDCTIKEVDDAKYNELWSGKSTAAKPAAT
jgi:hypothetical protein